MKKMIALALAMALLCGAALAEAGFALENGVAWGMGQGDVLAALGAADVDYDIMGLANVLEADAVYRGVEADAHYLFRDDALVAVFYELDAEDVDAGTLAAALGGDYGPMGDGDEAVFRELMSRITGREFTLNAQPRQGDFYEDWEASGVYVAFTNRPDDDGDDLYVFFFDRAAIAALAGADLGAPAPAL